MKINKIVVSYSTTVQMRQFEPLQIFVSADVQLDPGDHLDTTFRNVYKQLETEVEAQANKKKVERKATYDSEIEKSL